MNKLFRLTALAAALHVFTFQPIAAQWQVQDHAVPIGNGGGVTGFNAAAPSASPLSLISNGANSDPSFQRVVNDGITPGSSATIKCSLNSAVKDCGGNFASAVSFSVNNTHCYGTISATGGLTTVTLPSVAGGSFQDGCEVTVKNNETYTGTATGRGKILSGFPSDVNSILWPLQSVRVRVVNGAWVTTSNPGRWVVPSGQSPEICVRQDGATIADGFGNGTTAADCLKSAATAIVVIGQQWDGNGYSACQVGYYAGGTNIFNETVSATGQSVGCYLTYNWRGSVTHTSTGPCFTGGDNGIAIFNWNLGFTPTFQCNTSNTAGTGAFYCHQTCIYDFFGQAAWYPGGNNDHFLFIDGQGRVTASFSGAGFVIGNGVSNMTFSNVFRCDENCAQLQVSGNIGFSSKTTGVTSSGETGAGAIYAALGGSLMNLSASYTGSTPVAPTGAFTSGLSKIITNGTVFPATTQTVSNASGITCLTKC